MNPTTSTPKNELGNPLNILRTLRDEVRVRIHLAGMEARERWEKLDRDAEKLASRAEHASTNAIDELIGKLERLRDSLQAD
jgi:hypothetical protein